MINVVNGLVNDAGLVKAQWNPKKFSNLVIIIIVIDKDFSPLYCSKVILI